MLDLIEDGTASIDDRTGDDSHMILHDNQVHTVAGPDGEPEVPEDEEISGFQDF